MEPSKKIVDLNSGWIVCPSKSFPGKFYYFNLLNGEAVWRLNESHIKNLRNENTIHKITNQSHNYPEPINLPEENSNLQRLPTYGQNTLQHDYPNTEPYSWFPVQFAVPMFFQDKRYLIDENTQTSELECPIPIRTCNVPLSTRFQNYQPPCLTFDKNNKIVQKPVSKITVSTPLNDEFKKPPDPPLIPKSKLINRRTDSILKPNLDVPTQTLTKDKITSTANQAGNAKSLLYDNIKTEKITLSANQAANAKSALYHISKTEVAKAEAALKRPKGDTFNELDRSDLRFLLMAKRRKSMDADIVENESNRLISNNVEPVKPKKTVLFDLSNLSNKSDDDDVTDIIPMTTNQPKSPNCYEPESPPEAPHSNIELFKISPTNSENTSEIDEITDKRLLTKNLSPTTSSKLVMTSNQTPMTNKLPIFHASLTKDFIPMTTSTPMTQLFKNQAPTTRKMTTSTTLLTNNCTPMTSDQSLMISNQISSNIRKTSTVTSSTPICSYTPMISDLTRPSRQSTMTSDPMTLTSGQKTISHQTILTNEEMPTQSGYMPLTSEVYREMSKKMEVEDNWKETWFLIVDTDILLSDFSLINELLESDSNCKLLIPYCVKMELENLSVGDCQGQHQVFKARQLIRRFSTPPPNYIVQPPPMFEETKNKMGFMLNACLKASDANYFVVLITNNQQLQAATKALNIQSYNLSQIKHINGYSVKTSKEKENKNSLQSELFSENIEMLQAENKIQNRNVLEKKFDSKRSLYTKENFKNKECFDDKLKRFCVKSMVMEEKISSRIDEWLCTYTHIMEDVLNDLLQKKSNYMKDIMAPITLNETLNCIKMLYNNHTNIRDLIDELLELFKKINQNEKGGQKPCVSPENFMKMLGCGVLLVQDLQNIEPYSEELKDADSYLSLLLSAVENESIEFDPELLKCPVVKRAEIELEDSIRQNYTKDITYILDYLRKHFQSWASYKDFEVPHWDISPNKVLRTSGKNLKMLKIDNNKGLTLTKDTEEQNNRPPTEPKTIELVHNKPILEIKENVKPIIHEGLINNNNLINKVKDDFILYGNEFPQKPIKKIEPKIIRNMKIIEKYEKRHYSEIHEHSVNDITDNLQFNTLNDNRNYNPYNDNNNSRNHNDNSYKDNDNSRNQNDNFGITDRVVNLDDIMPRDMDLDTATEFTTKTFENNAYISENIIKNTKFVSNNQEYNNTTDIYSVSSQSTVKKEVTKSNIKIQCVKHIYDTHNNKNMPNNDNEGRNNDKNSGNEDKMEHIVVDDSTLDSGFENDSTCAHSVVKIFLNELSTTFKLVYKFVKQFLNDLNDKRFDEMNMESLHDQASKALEHMVAIIQKLKSIIERESPEETKLKCLLRNAGVDATMDKRITRYRQVVIKCLEQAKILKNALKIIASTTVGDFDAISTKESINSSIKYFNIFE